MNSRKLQALISLLDDPSEQVFSQIKDEILELGEDVIPSLETAWEENSFGVLFQQRIENIIHSIQFDSVRTELHNWVINGSKNLLEGIILVAKFQYPDMNEERIHAEIDQLKKDIWLEINDNLTGLEKVKVMNYILFDVHGYSGNKKNYHAPQNSFINDVIETKKGNPLSLSVLYMIIANQLDIPLYGVNLPKHFVLAYGTSNKGKIFPEAKEILFYVNPFSRGAIFSRANIDEFIMQLKLEPSDSFYVPCDNQAIIARVINNLIYSYEKIGYADKVEDLNILKQSLKI